MPTPPKVYIIEYSWWMIVQWDWDSDKYLLYLNLRSVSIYQETGLGSVVRTVYFQQVFILLHGNAEFESRSKFIFVPQFHGYQVYIIFIKPTKLVRNWNLVMLFNSYIFFTRLNNKHAGHACQCAQVAEQWAWGWSLRKVFQTGVNCTTWLYINHLKGN